MPGPPLPPRAAQIRTVSHSHIFHDEQSGNHWYLALDMCHSIALKFHYHTCHSLSLLHLGITFTPPKACVTSYRLAAKPKCNYVWCVALLVILYQCRSHSQKVDTANRLCVCIYIYIIIYYTCIYLDMWDNLRKLATFDYQGCTQHSLPDPRKTSSITSSIIIHTHLTTIKRDPTEITFPHGTGWLWRPFWRNGWWNLCNPHIMWSDCSWTKRTSRRLWKSDSINPLCWFKGTSILN